MASRTDAPAAVRAEQLVVTRMYERLDELTARATRDLARAKRSPTAGTPAAQVEREAMIRAYADRLGALVSAERRLCFGRLDFSARGSSVYIGRLSLADESQSLLLTDWRAPAAEPFYRATGASPMGVSRRRHIALDGRMVAAVEDDLLVVGGGLDVEGGGGQLEGSGALMAALAARRTGRMGDIVATIQAEQDRIIRAPLAGILVVEGGPGCGKTVVGLHRAAYLLYTHREQIARSGVLVVGPTTMFLRYISQVLPGLGESSAVLATPGQLFPGVDAAHDDKEPVAAVKGDLRMAEVIANAIRNRQRVPEAVRWLNVAGTRISMTPSMVAAARDRARASRKPHNRSRVTFVLTLLDRLARTLAAARGVDPDTNRDVLLADLRDSPDVRREVNLCWMPLTAQRLVADLWTDPRVLAAAAPRLSARERSLLARSRGAPWTVSDVPLLDEAAELLGEDDEPARRAAAVVASERAVEEEYARGVLEMTGVAGLTAGALIERYAGDGRVRRSIVDFALEDRTWAYGHVVVDEAQELSPMQWRLLLRRCPTKSMTVVGDPAQASHPAAPRAWSDVLDRVAPGRWSVERLSVNYRTPAPIMELAARVLAAAGDATEPPRSVRDGPSPRIRAVAATADPAQRQHLLIEAAVGDLRTWIDEEGRSAVIVPAEMADAFARGLARGLPPGTLGFGPSALETRVTLVTALQAKGLEFDQVVVVEPADITASSTRGAHTLYVALTRATREIRVIHSSPLPSGFRPRRSAAAGEGRPVTPRA